MTIVVHLVAAYHRQHLLPGYVKAVEALSPALRVRWLVGAYQIDEDAKPLGGGDEAWPGEENVNVVICKSHGCAGFDRHPSVDVVTVRWV